MYIYGFQKLTLLDFPGKIACTLFTGGCNFRCPFCHNASLVTHINGDYFDEEEIFSYLKKRKGLLEGVCVTGGEPTLYHDLLPFLAKIKELGYSVKLDTNGSAPDVLQAAVKENYVDYVAMDIKNSLHKYPETIGLSSYDTEPIQRSAAFLMSGAVPFEFRTTVVAGLHDEPSFREIGAWLAGPEPYYLQHFVDSGDLIQPGTKGVDAGKIAAFRDILRRTIPNAAIRDA